jgi:HEAT repeat protein/Mg-chelatase subunit ChlD
MLYGIFVWPVIANDVDKHIQNLKDPNPEVRHAAADALKELKDARAVEPLIWALKDEDKWVRVKAAEALGLINDSSAVDPLIKALEDEDQLVRSSAIRALGQIQDPRAVDPLIHALKDEKSVVRGSAAYDLGYFKEPRAIDPLILALKDNDAHVRKGAACSLRNIGDTRAVDPLTQALEDNDAGVRAEAAYALGELNDSRAVDPLIQALKDENANVRRRAAYALGWIKDSKAVDPLIQALKDEDIGVRQEVASALKWLKVPIPTSLEGTNSISIQGIDLTLFPTVKISILINSTCAIEGFLEKSDFKIKEEGKDMVIDSVIFTGNASGLGLDLAFIFDNTGSMAKEADSMKSKVQGLVDQIRSTGMDARYSLVTFKDEESVRLAWTNDTSSFKKAVNNLAIEEGGDEPEVALDAIEAVISLGFRPTGQKVMVVITDASAHHKEDSSGFSNYTKEEVMEDLNKSGVILMTVSPIFEKNERYIDLKKIADERRSPWIDINSANFSLILDKISRIITGTYVIEYNATAMPPLTDYELLHSPRYRLATVSVDKPECAVANILATYREPPPKGWLPPRWLPPDPSLLKSPAPPPRS